MHSALVVKLHLLHQMSQLCLILPSQSQLEASTRTNLRLGNVPVEVGLGSCSLRQSNKNNQKVDISKKKQKDPGWGQGGEQTKWNFKKNYVDRPRDYWEEYTQKVFY